MAGDVGLIADGIKNRDPYRVAGGGLFTLAAVNLAHFGNARPEHYAHEVEDDLRNFIRKEGGVLPEDDRQTKRHGRALMKARNFLYRYPAQVALGLSAIGAGTSILSGIKRNRADGEWGGLGFGISLLGLKLASILIPEKPKTEKTQDKASQHHELIGKAVDWVREKPLRIYGYGMFVADVFLGINAFQQFKKAPKQLGYVFTAGSTVSYMLEDIMMAISHKDHVNVDGKFTSDEQRGIEALAAAAVAAAPGEKRVPMAQRLGEFLVKRKEMQGDAGSISRSIIEQAEHRQDNPWVSRSSRAEMDAAPVR